MKTDISKRLLAEYRNPLQFLDKQSYQRLRNQFVKRALLCVTIGAVFLVIMFMPDQTGNAVSPAQLRGNFAMMLLGFGLPLYGLFQVATIKHSIANSRRAQLVWLNPDLKSLVPVQKIKNLPPMRSRVIIDAAVIVIAVSAVTLWALSL